MKNSPTSIYLRASGMLMLASAVYVFQFTSLNDLYKGLLFGVGIGLFLLSFFGGKMQNA
ncbi:MAG: hypothetical protein K1X56_14780 [Flavobacteriales bacterium]|nr:hypothetical protein [Flavobacteriales bacterium]